MHRKQNSFVARWSVGVLVPGPERDDEGGALLPVERLAVDDGRAAAPAIANLARFLKTKEDPVVRIYDQRRYPTQIPRTRR